MSSFIFHRSIFRDLRSHTCYLPDERDMHAHRAVLAGALVAEEDADVGAAPLWVLLLAVETALVLRKGHESG